MTRTRYIFYPLASRTSGGFTLVELLVVIAIIALLMAVVIPSASRALVAGRRVQCTSNMRQIGQGVLQFALDRYGDLPPTRHSAAAGESWIFLLRPYVGDIEAIRISPSDPLGAERLRRRSTSYILNEVICDPIMDFDERVGGYGNIDLIDAPSATFLAFVISDNKGTDPSNDHTHARTWNNFARFLVDVEPDRHRVGGRHPSRLRGNAPYLYLDSSVRVHEPELLQTLLDGGQNVGQPGQAP